MRKLLVVVLVGCGGGGVVTQPVTPVSVAGPPEPVKAAQPAPPPAAPEHPVATDTFHGVTVTDPYRWLEGNTPDVQAWSEAQDAAARKLIDALPELPKLRAEVRAIVNAPTTDYGGFQAAGGHLFALRKRPNQEQPELIVLDDPAHPEAAKVIFDPTSGGNAHVAIDWFEPAPDGKHVAVSISAGGSEKGDLHVFDLAGKDVEPPLANVQRGTAGGDVAWTPDSKSFYYTRYTDGDFFVQIWFHTLGTTPDKDHYELGKDQPKVAEYLLETDSRGRLLVQIQNGDGGTYRHYLRDAKGTWRQLADWDDQVTYASFGTGDEIWLVSTKDAPHGKLLRLAPAAALAKAATVVAEGKDTIVTRFAERAVVDVGGRLYMRYQTGGPTELRVFSRAGKPLKAPALPAVAAVREPARWRDGVIVGVSTFTSPLAYYAVMPKGLDRLAAISPAAPVDLSKFEVNRELATSKDGTKVPLTIIWPPGAPKDGSTPCLVYGYGGYGISQTPHYVANLAPLLQRGVCYVIANLRGGAEFGEDWHRAGMLTNKQNVFDDFAAVMGYVVDQKYTSRDRLGILGGSNGGLLMGAMLTQHPDMMKVVVSEVGIYDMLRVELTPNGQFNITEFGTVKDEAQFKAMYAYSPLHHVVKGTSYPATLFMTGANDPRVEPWHSRKMLAAMKDAQAGSAPLLLRVSKDSGHGIGTNMSEEIDQLATVHAFLLWQLRGARS
jgi:prolyl oligopeptidase